MRAGAQRPLFEHLYFCLGSNSAGGRVFQFNSLFCTLRHRSIVGASQSRNPDSRKKPRIAIDEPGILNNREPGLIL